MALPSLSHRLHELTHLETGHRGLLPSRLASGPGARGKGGVGAKSRAGKRRTTGRTSSAQGDSPTAGSVLVALTITLGTREKLSMLEVDSHICLQCGTLKCGHNCPE